MPCISQKGLDELVALCTQVGKKKKTPQTRGMTSTLEGGQKQKKQVNEIRIYLCIRILPSQWWDQMRKDSSVLGALELSTSLFLFSCCLFLASQLWGPVWWDGNKCPNCLSKESLGCVCSDPADHKVEVEEQQQRTLPVFYMGLWQVFIWVRKRCQNSRCFHGAIFLRS